MYLPTVSKTFKMAIRNIICQAIPFSTPVNMLRFVSIDAPGKTTKVTMKITANATKNVHATLKLFFNIIKKACMGDTWGCDLMLLSSVVAGLTLAAVLLISFDEPFSIRRFTVSSSTALLILL